MKEMEKDESDSGGGSESVHKMKPGERIGAIIRSDKVPYVVTLLLAGIAWSTTRIVDRVTQIPILEFCIREQSQNGERAVSCDVTNLCYKIFRGLNLHLTTEDAGTHIQRPEIAYIKPIMPNIRTESRRGISRFRATTPPKNAAVFTAQSIFVQTGVSYGNMFLNNLRSDLKN